MRCGHGPGVRATGMLAEQVDMPRYDFSPVALARAGLGFVC